MTLKYLLNFNNLSILRALNILRSISKIIGIKPDKTARRSIIAGQVHIYLILVINFEDFFLVKEDLSDIRFVAQDDKTPLKFHVESFDLLNQLAFIWVKLPLTQAVGDAPRKIWMYYGNSQAVAAQDAAGTYGVDKVAVYHFNPGNPSPQDVNGGKQSEKSSQSCTLFGLKCTG